ncbi:TQO small subunit DoxD [Thermophagus xiamenensis]|uniref:Thiosulfate dehydrogenase [quinone] large subunit n=1 Tax=Thermophagus xiamenensis TaxID=385682 RepID=A0A1I2EMP7_9BACT|nr:TQO small subunit DoxD [Thermophagus xiamenensis]SFE94135.1 thiosulfate dehydrogenase [quinone] large subunit [Thermophagus xiamenensis]
MNDNRFEHIQYKEGLFTLALRLVVGWTYFSAFWRRLFLADKLNPEAAGYIGEKFNHFLPNALGIKPMIEYLVLHPDLLWWAMVIFTIIEGVVGLLFMFGLLTRLMSIGVFSLATGILMGSGWLGTTCLDEWQIGVLGIAAGFTVFIAGSDKYSLDYWLMKNKPVIAGKKWFNWLGSGALSIRESLLSKIVLAGSLFILFITLFTNQYFHGGLWGPLHNKSVKPRVEISDAKISGNTISFEVFRTEGVDVYGSFLIGIRLEDEQGETVLKLDGEALASFPKERIENRYVTKVKPGKHSLIIPLGARAVLSIVDDGLMGLPNGKYKVILTDISGVEWSSETKK